MQTATRSTGPAPVSPPPFVLYPAEVDVLQSKPFMPTREWAAKHFRIVTGQYAGQFFRHDLIPYAAGIMDAWDDPAVRELIMCGVSQVTKTSIAYACLMSALWRDPGPAGVAMPDEKHLARVMEEKLGPHMRRSVECRAMLANVRDPILRNKILLRHASIWGIHMGSEASMSSITLRYLLVDEEDACTDHSAVGVVRERVTSYADVSKILRYSKPRGGEQESTIWAALKTSCQTVYEWRAVCPACRTPQVMRQERIRIPKDERDPARIWNQRLARYECEGCGYRWNDHTRDLAVRAGHWYAERVVRGASTVGFHMPSWISPFVSLSKIMQEYMEALQDGSPAKLAAFDNSHGARAYKAIAIETDADRLRRMVRHDLPPLVAPEWAVALTCGIDVQMTGFWFVVRAWGRGGESSLVQYGWLTTWDDVRTQVFDTTYPVAGRDDVVMPIWRAGIDIGGTEDVQASQGWSKTEEVKMWLLEHDPEGDTIRGVKGASRDMDQMVRASTMQRDPKAPAKWQDVLPLMLINTTDMKDLIHLVRFREDSRQAMWLHSETDENYIRQLTAEKRRHEKGKRAVWDAGSRANHLLDCEVYAAACAHVDWAPALATLGDPVWRRLQPARQQYQQQPASPLAGRLHRPVRVNPWARQD